MIILAHCVGQPFDWQAAELLPELEQAAESCRGTTVGISVVAILNAAQQSLRARLPAQAAKSTSDSEVGVKGWTAHFSGDPDALRRVLHHLRANFALFAPGSHEWCESKKQSHAHSRCLRLPVIPAAQPAESLNAWLSFLATQLDPAVPLLGLLPVGQHWLDVIVGEPDLADLFHLRTLPTAAPLVSAIPYRLEPAASPHEARILAGVGRGHLPDISCFNGATVEANQLAAARWLSKFRLNFFSRLLRSTGSPF